MGFNSILLLISLVALLVCGFSLGYSTGNKIGHKRGYKDCQIEFIKGFHQAGMLNDKVTKKLLDGVQK